MDSLRPYFAVSQPWQIGLTLLWWGILTRNPWGIPVPTPRGSSCYSSTMTRPFLRAGTCLGVAALLVGCEPGAGAHGVGVSSTGDEAGVATAAREPLPDLSELPVFDLPFSVAEAYAAIPHRHTVFDFGSSSVPPEDAEYLQLVFHLLDQGTRTRVTAYRDLYHRGASEARPTARYTELISLIEGFTPPAPLRPYRDAVLRALRDQRAFFEEWTRAGSGFPFRDQIAGHPKVRSASRALQQAYRLLISRYGASESRRNRDALFDVHCALDFL